MLSKHFTAQRARGGGSGGDAGGIDPPGIVPLFE
jgi:hypothetical protein